MLLRVKSLTALFDNVTIYARIKNSYNGSKEVFYLGPSCSRPIGANPGLNFNPSSFFFSLKSPFQIIFSIIFSPSNYQTVDKKNSTQFAFLHFHI